MSKQQHRCLIRKNKVYNISTQNKNVECLVNFQKGLFRFYSTESKKPIIVPSKNILRLCSILETVQEQKIQHEHNKNLEIVAAQVENKIIKLNVEINNWDRQSVFLVEYKTDYKGFCILPGNAIEFNAIDVKMLQDAYLKCKPKQTY